MNLNLSPLSKILAILVLVTMVLSPVGVSNVAAQSSAPTISTYAELPVKGQLIIPPGAVFTVPAEWHGLTVTIWRGMGDPAVSAVVVFGESIAKDRAKLYGGSLSDYQTVIWDAVANPKPGFTGRTKCDTEFRGDGIALGKDTKIGDSGCFEMIEFDQTQQPVSAESLAAQNAIEATPTAAPVATATNPPAIVGTPTSPAVVSTQQAVAVQPTSTNDPNVVFHKDVTVTNNGLQWLALLVVVALVLFAIFRRPVAPVATVAPKATTTRRSTTTKKKTRK